jgi:hypothetical protein
MQSWLDALQAQVRYRRHDLEADADRARLARVTRRVRLIGRRDARRLHAEVSAFLAGAAPVDQRPFETMSAGTWRR